jgi:hypothetical protein
MPTGTGNWDARTFDTPTRESVWAECGCRSGEHGEPVCRAPNVGAGGEERRSGRQDEDPCGFVAAAHDKQVPLERACVAALDYGAKEVVDLAHFA